MLDLWELRKREVLTKKAECSNCGRIATVQLQIAMALCLTTRDASFSVANKKTIQADVGLK